MSFIVAGVLALGVVPVLLCAVVGALVTALLSIVQVQDGSAPLAAKVLVIVVFGITVAPLVWARFEALVVTWYATGISL